MPTGDYEHKICLIHGSYFGAYCYECQVFLESVVQPLATNLCDIHGYNFGKYCIQCSQAINSLTFKVNKEMQRKYLPTLSELIDRMTIVQQKELKIPQNRDEYTKELEDLMHDIQLCLDDSGNGYNGQHAIDVQTIRDIIVLTLMNCEIWHNESNFRKGIKTGNDLELTHGLNGIRNIAKNKIQEKFGGRKDYKVDNVKAFKDWIPSGYNSDEKECICENCGLECHPNMPCEEVGGIDKRKNK